MGSALTETPVWRELLKHQETLASAGALSDLILSDPERLGYPELALDGIRLNLAFHRMTPKTIELLIKLAQQQKVEDKRAQLFRGDKINVTENRAVLHTALRQKGNQPLMVDGRDILQDVKAARQQMKNFVGDVREGRWKGATGQPIRHIVNIGIGGSDLGPRLAVGALASDAADLKVHFVANVDAFDLLSTLQSLDPAQTLFVIVSKTFTTQETLLNATTARQWLTGKLGEKAVAQHFVAVSANTGEVQKFGIDAERIFPMWDWVGGRFSLWSTVGLGIALAIGMENFERMLDGAAAMDEHFRTAPLAQNMPVILALLGVWYRNFWDMQAQAILPYSERLRDLPRYLQQLEMESNGKSVTCDGKPVDYETAPIIFGECGSVGQHSFHQWLHQGSDIVASDFIGVVQDDLRQPEHHQALLANMVAQAGALAFGQTKATAPSDIYVGNRPSTILLLDQLDPYRFGMLLALYEHKVFTQGVIWNINSFDQPGVELGKRMARNLERQDKAQDRAGAFLTDFWHKIGSVNKK